MKLVRILVPINEFKYWSVKKELELNFIFVKEKTTPVCSKSAITLLRWMLDIFRSR